MYRGTEHGNLLVSPHRAVDRFTVRASHGSDDSIPEEPPVARAGKREQNFHIRDGFVTTPFYFLQPVSD